MRGRGKRGKEIGKKSTASRRNSRPFSYFLIPFSLFLLPFCLSGCHFDTFPDPNDPSLAGEAQPEVLRRQVKGASDALFARRLSNEITEQQYQNLLAQFTDELLKSTHVESVDATKAWEYGEVYRTARKWKEAEILYRAAVKVAKDDDRRVNDSLFLAEALAQQGKVEEAIKTARTTFDTPGPFKAPILYAVLYQIVPGGQGKGKDSELAHLLEDSIRQSDLVEVDQTIESGNAFKLALPHHQHNARELAAKLYLGVGKAADAERVLGGKLPTMRI